MKLFRWKSEALKDYIRGDILAIGVDIEDARSKARKQFDKVVDEKWNWLADYKLDEDEKKQRDDKLALLESDIMAEPEVADTFFIAGGDSQHKPLAGCYRSGRMLAVEQETAHEPRQVCYRD